MKEALGFVAEKLRKAERRALIRRAMWVGFEERLTNVFAEIDSHGQDASKLGNLYLSFSKTSFPAYDKSHVSRFNSLNQAQISVGWRRVGVWHSLGEGADEFLGTQGDVWDTQSDIFCAFIGSIVSQITLARVHDRQLQAMSVVQR